MTLTYKQVVNYIKNRENIETVDYPCRWIRTFRNGNFVGTLIDCDYENSRWDTKSRNSEFMKKYPNNYRPPEIANVSFYATDIELTVVNDKIRVKLILLDSPMPFQSRLPVICYFIYELVELTELLNELITKRIAEEANELYENEEDAKKEKRVKYLQNKLLRELK